MYPYQKDNTMIIVFILLMICSCCSGIIYCAGIALYAYYYYSDPDGYTKYEKACVSDNNLFTYQNVDTVRQCAKVCDKMDQCLAFEVYADHGGDNPNNHRPGLCQLNISDDRSDCNGQSQNLNLYVKDSLPPSSDLEDLEDPTAPATCTGTLTSDPLPETGENCADLPAFLESSVETNCPVSDGCIFTPGSQDR